MTDDLARNLRAYREAHDLNQRELAQSAHVSPAFISNLETAGIKNPGAFFLYAVAVTLGVRMEDLMGVQRIETTTKGRVTARRERTP